VRRARRRFEAAPGYHLNVPNVEGSVSDLLSRLSGIVHIHHGELEIVDPARLRADGIRDLAWTAAFGADPATVEAAQWIVWEAAQALGARSASIHDLYMARARGEVSGFTVPAINIRAQTFDMARIVYETATTYDVRAVLLELARSEQTYTFQRPIDYSTAVLAGAIAANWRGPVFLQGDHYQFNAKKYAADQETMTEEIRRACRLAIDAGYRNIDIDASTLVDLSKPNADEEQRENYQRTAELVALIRALEADGVTVSIGGEIGEVGKANSNEAELRAYLDGLRRELERGAPGAVGISKVSVQTGTSHGGMVMPDGSVGLVAVDFGVHERLGAVARDEYGLAGTVQHGASTLPDELFHRFRDVETAEIHLATGFQNALYGHPAFPRELHEQIEAWCFVNALDERKADQTDQQFVYTSRKKAIGPFKRQLWDLSTKDEILTSQAQKIAFLFHELGVENSRDMVERYVKPVVWHRPLPASLAEAAPVA
jgi:fructose/tagatose bisphosphate aldolase